MGHKHTADKSEQWDKEVGDEIVTYISWYCSCGRLVGTDELRRRKK